MKNSFKIGFLALAIAVSAAACKGTSSSSTADSAATTDSATTTVDTTVKADTGMKMAADTTAKDTTKK